jgi:hypothetical protein
MISRGRQLRFRCVTPTSTLCYDTTLIGPVLVSLKRDATSHSPKRAKERANKGKLYRQVVERSVNLFAPSGDFRNWPIATDRILMADRRFRGITDMAGAAAGSRTSIADEMRIEHTRRVLGE